MVTLLGVHLKVCLITEGVLESQIEILQSNDSFMGHWHLFTGTEAEVEADGVAEVTKQLEKQAIEDKEKEEEGEEGD